MANGTTQKENPAIPAARVKTRANKSQYGKPHLFFAKFLGAGPIMKCEPKAMAGVQRMASGDMAAAIESLAGGNARSAAKTWRIIFPGLKRCHIEDQCLLSLAAMASDSKTVRANAMQFISLSSPGLKARAIKTILCCKDYALIMHAAEFLSQLSLPEKYDSGLPPIYKEKLDDLLLNAKIHLAHGIKSDADYKRQRQQTRTLAMEYRSLHHRS